MVERCELNFTHKCEQCYYWSICPQEMCRRTLKRRIYETFKTAMLVLAIISFLLVIATCTF